jgi:glutathione synthase
MKSLWRIYKTALQNGYNQKLSLSVLRVDYMLHQRPNSDVTKLKQVEINTISAGFGFASTRMSSLHRNILNWSGYKNLLDKLPENAPVEGIARGFVEAWRLYGNRKAIVIFLVLDIEINIGDQRHIEYEIVKQEPDIEVVRCTLTQIHEFGHLNEDKMLMFNDQEVAVVYFRAGYDPIHYKSEKV